MTRHTVLTRQRHFADRLRRVTQGSRMIDGVRGTFVTHPPLLRWALVRDTSTLQRARRIGLGLLQSACRQLMVSLTTFRAQFRATTESDVAAWQAALQASAVDGHIAARWKVGTALCARSR
jgi:hypothetical protein